MDAFVEFLSRHHQTYSIAKEQGVVRMPMSAQEKLAMLKELDAVIKSRYHQSLDEVLRDLYVHNVISKPELSAEEILRTFESINVLKNEMESVLERYRH